MVDTINLEKRDALGLDRRAIAKHLLWILSGIVAASFAALFWILAVVRPLNIADIEKIISLLNVLFGPVITLVGAATGYYFGSAGTTPKLAHPGQPPAPGGAILGPPRDPAAPSPATTEDIAVLDLSDVVARAKASAATGAAAENPEVE